MVTIMMALLAGCGSENDDAGSLHTAEPGRDMERSRLDHALPEQKARVEAIHAAGEAQDRAAATRQAIAVRNGTAGDEGTGR